MNDRLKNKVRLQGAIETILWKYEYEKFICDTTDQKQNVKLLYRRYIYAWENGNISETRYGDHTFAVETY